MRLIIVPLVAACGGTAERGTGIRLLPPSASPPASPAPHLAPPEAPSSDAPLPSAPTNVQEIIYAHSAQMLYKLDPNTFDVTPIAPFQWGSAFDEMTDIAVDKNGHMIGVSRSRIYEVDPETGACRSLSHSDQEYYALSFVLDPSSQAERLIGVANHLPQGAGPLGNPVATVYAIDPETGVSQEIGPIGGSLYVSGDVVGLQDGRVYITVRDHQDASSDYLARIDIETGRATRVGRIGGKDIWGTGFWGNRLYGFSANGDIFAIELDTGQGTVVSQQQGSWWVPA